MFGHSRAEALGHSLDLIIPPRLQPAHWRGFAHAVATGATQHGGVAVLTSAIHKSGAKVYAEVAFSLLEAADGTVVGAVAIARSRPRGG